MFTGELPGKVEGPPEARAVSWRTRELLQTSLSTCTRIARLRGMLWAMLHSPSAWSVQEETKAPSTWEFHKSAGISHESYTTLFLHQSIVVSVFSFVCSERNCWWFFMCPLLEPFLQSWSSSDKTSHALRAFLVILAFEARSQRGRHEVVCESSESQARPTSRDDDL